MRPDASAKSPVATPDTSVPSSPAPTPAAPAVRPRLNLAKRTVSEAEPALASSSSDSKSNPFGAARPIDTAAREKEVEEKRQLALRQKKEQEDKAREEKKARDAAAKSEKEKAVPATPTSPKEPSSKASKENGIEEKSASLNYEILRNVGNENAYAEAEDDAVDAPANGNIVEDKVKPKEVVRNPPQNKSEGAWRRKSGTPAAPAGSTTGGLEEDGWSTVPQKSKNNRRGGNQGARAIAS